jgi:hypothetical protein
MSDIRCESCGLTFKNKRLLASHFKSTKHNKLIKNEIRKKFGCECGKWYIHHQSLNKHRKTCAHLNSSVAEIRQVLEEEREQHQKERDELRAQIALLLDKHAGSTTTNNQHIETQNIETQQNIHIHINAFGHENIDYLDEKAIVACIDRVYKSVPAILEKIHFDPNHPENHNIKITNRKLPYASVMGENKKWKTVDKKDAIETMVFNGYNLLDEKYPDNKDNLTNYKREKFEDFQDNFQNEDRKLHKQLRTDVELMILNQ